MSHGSTNTQKGTHLEIEHIRSEYVTYLNQFLAGVLPNELSIGDLEAEKVSNQSVYGPVPAIVER